MGLIFTFYGLLALLTGYLFGSLPFGLLLTRWAGLGDVRAIGSGNIGATNVLRTGHKGLAAATLLLDLLKGTIAVLIVYEVAKRFVAFDAYRLAYVAGLGALVGHLFPVWLGFKGGKGVATFIGVLLGAHWPAAVVFALVWLGVAAVWRYSSLAALSATAAVIVYYLVFGQAGLIFVLLMVALIVFKHQANIRRLLDGAEARIGAKS
ncbi:MAG TPA: glycerol-3-phosphate 1-O-acyltransferase PlsY [Hyphomicrobiaceae bacterium]|jgi:glycerol-3-phosphate acyltransferase PlsY|nr:glycerol-3-phosphate 1-O-acyltransferase PlsY [Hyphomicrobiaceae bacterium]